MPGHLINKQELYSEYSGVPGQTLVDLPLAVNVNSSVKITRVTCEEEYTRMTQRVLL